MHCSRSCRRHSLPMFLNGGELFNSGQTIGKSLGSPADRHPAGLQPGTGVFQRLRAQFAAALPGGQRMFDLNADGEDTCTR